jgi:hypothetical protein
MPSSLTPPCSHIPLMGVLADVPDPRDPRGVRHGLAVVLGAPIVGGMTLAVPGATGFVALAQRTVIVMSGSCHRPGSGTPCAPSLARAVSGGTCAGLTRMPARIIYRDPGALRHANFDRSTAICPS